MPRLILLASATAALDPLARAVAASAEGANVLVRAAGGPLDAAIERARAELGPVPIGVAARDAAEALLAIELGADEAMAITSVDVASVLELIDRTRARGRLRREWERQRVDIAHSEKLAALGTLVAGVAHEVNNPLAVIVLTLDTLALQLKSLDASLAELRRAADHGRGLEPTAVAALVRRSGRADSVIEQVEQMAEAAEAIRLVVADLRVFARNEEDERPQLVRVPELLDHLLRLLGRELGPLVVIERDYPLDLPEVVVPRARFTQVLTNIFVNASHAIREVKRDLHRIRISLRADDEMLALSITDTGPGIAPEAIERIFDPFFTTKRAMLGTGLGLSISRNLMRRIGGDLLVESVFGEGATFVVLVPRPDPDELRTARGRVLDTITVGTARARISALIVEPDPSVLAAYSRALGRRFDILTATDANEAIEMLQSGSHADVVLADLGSVPHDGAHLHAWLLEHRPEIAPRVVFVTDDARVAREVLASTTNPVLSKATPPAVLVTTLEDASRR